MAALARLDGDELLSVPPLPPNYQARPDMESVLRTALLNSSGGAVIGLTARSLGPAGIGKTTPYVPCATTIKSEQNFPMAYSGWRLAASVPATSSSNL